MPTPATGELRLFANGFEARIRIDDAGKRKGYFLAAIPRTEKAAARERCTAMAKIALRLRRAGYANDIDRIMTDAAKARAGKSWDSIVAAVEILCSGGTEPIPAKASVTFGTLAREWCSGELHQRFPDDVPKKRTSDDDLRRLGKWVFPVLEHVPVGAVTLASAREVLARIPPEKSRATRKHVAWLMNRVLKWAVYPCEYIERNPLPPGFGGSKGKLKAMTYLYPSEDRALLSCEDVPIVHRLFYGLLAREGLRSNEAQKLTWGDLDLERGSIRLDRNKTDDPRAWALDAGVHRTLKWWKAKHENDEPTDKIFRALEKPYWMAIMFRRHLAAAKVNRPELTEKSDVRQPIRVHDLRATFVTVSLANGKTEAWIADRTGHRSSAMINRYRRAARTHAELGQGALAPLDEALGLATNERPEGSGGPAASPRERPDASSTRATSVHLETEIPAEARPLEDHAARARGSNPLGDAVLMP